MSKNSLCDRCNEPLVSSKYCVNCHEVHVHLHIHPKRDMQEIVTEQEKELKDQMIKDLEKIYEIDKCPHEYYNPPILNDLKDYPTAGFFIKNGLFYVCSDSGTYTCLMLQPVHCPICKIQFKKEVKQDDKGHKAKDRF